MEYAYLCIIGLACVTALGNWRLAIYFCLMIDALRDPVRKLLPEQPVWATFLGIIPWGVMILRAFSAEQPELLAAFSRYPKLSSVIFCLMTALVPGFVLSCLTYENGHLIAAVGSLSYLGPFLGIGMGYLFVRSERMLTSFLAAYVVINGVALTGAFLEFFAVDVPGLGGIRMDWIRYRDGYIVDLISGFYRSPDVMGLHAAHVMVFAAILALRSRGLIGLFWLLMIVWGGAGVLLCGRRKMILIPLVFIVCYAVMNYFIGSSKKISVVVIGGACLFIGVVGSLLTTLPEWAEYTEYASTTVSEAPDRVSNNVIGGMFETLRQTGMIGAGLGTATQGRYYVATTKGGYSRGWQEDGLSRIVLELGLPGFLLMIMTACLMAGVFLSAIRLTAGSSSIRDWQAMFAAVVLGNVASFIASHQQYSGDPISALLVTFIGGAILGMPRLVALPNLPGASHPPDAQPDAAIRRDR
jgi:hypothetical protein